MIEISLNTQTCDNEYIKICENGHFAGTDGSDAESDSSNDPRQGEFGDKEFPDNEGRSCN